MPKRLPLLIFASLLFAQCSLWDSTTAYFNTFYNASRLFSEGEDEVWSQPDTRYAGTNWLLKLDPPQPARARFSSVIEKCSKLLQYHPESGLVDDALLLIAKSYFYQGEVQKAERKCLELLDNHPESDLRLETRVLLAYTLFKMNDKAGAAKIAREVVEGEEGSGDVFARACLLLGNEEQERQNMAEALSLFERAGDAAGGGDLRAVAYLRAAECATKTGDYARAESLCRQAASATGNYVLEFRSKLGALQARSHAGYQAEAIRELRDLRENQNYREYFGEVDLAAAEAYRSAGDLAAATAQFAYVDTAYARTEYGARGGYELGRIYENDLKLLDSALAAYNRSRTAMPTSESGTLSRDRAEILTRYFRFRGELIRCDTLLRNSGPQPDSTVLKAAGRGDSLSARVRDSILTSAEKGRRARVDSLGELRAFAMSEIANVFYTDLDLRDSAWTWYARVAEEYPASIQTGRALFVIAQMHSSDSTGNRAVADSLLREVVKRFPDSDFAAEARKRLGLPAVAKAGMQGFGEYQEAEKKILSGKGGEALPELRSIVRKYPSSPLAPRAQYAIGWIYEHQLAMPESSLSAYKRLTTLFPSSPAAATVMPMLAVVEQERKAQPVPAPQVVDTVAVPVRPAEETVRPQEQRPEVPVQSAGPSTGRNSGRESRLRARRME